MSRTSQFCVGVGWGGGGKQENLLASGLGADT